MATEDPLKGAPSDVYIEAIIAALVAALIVRLPKRAPFISARSSSSHHRKRWKQKHVHDCCADVAAADFTGMRYAAQGTATPGLVKDAQTL
jgi:hypothetical protein